MPNAYFLNGVSVSLYEAKYAWQTSATYRNAKLRARIWPNAHGRKPDATARQHLAEAGIVIARVPGPRRKATAPAKPCSARTASSAKTQRLLDLLEDGPGLTGELAVELGISPSWASSRLHDLAEQGKVEKVPFLGPNLCTTALWCLKAGAHE